MSQRRAEQRMFERDYAEKPGNVLKEAIIEAMIQQEITFEMFIRMHKNYMVSIGTPVGKIASSRNNLLKDLFSDKELSYKRFSHLMRDILGLNLTNFSMTLRNKLNEQFYLSIDRLTY